MASDPASLLLTADRTELKPVYGDLAYVTVAVVDSAGVIVKYAEPNITLEVEGVGDLIAIGTANPISEESYVGSQRKAYQGRLLAVVRTDGQAGEITLKAQTEGLPASQIQLQVK